MYSELTNHFAGVQLGDNLILGFESLVNSEGSITSAGSCRHRYEFESLVNSEGSKTALNSIYFGFLFESLVNSEGSKTTAVR